MKFLLTFYLACFSSLIFAQQQQALYAGNANWKVSDENPYAGQTVTISLSADITPGATLRSLRNTFENLGEQQPVVSKEQSGKFDRVTYSWQFITNEPKTFSLPNQIGAIVEKIERFGLMSVASNNPVLLTLTPITFSVRPLPPSPENFNGAIGKYKITGNLSKTEFQPGDILQANITITAEEGGIAENFTPAIKFEENGLFRGYSMKKNGETKNSITFSFSFVPLEKESTQLPDITFPFFNIELGKYDIATWQPPVLRFKEQTETVADTPEIRTLGSMEEQTAKTGVRALFFAPSSFSPIIAQVPDDAEPKILETANAWSRVEIKNHRGWILTSKLQKKGNK